MPPGWLPRATKSSTSHAARIDPTSICSAFDDDAAAKQVQAGASPFDEQRFVSLPKRALGAVRPGGRQPEEAVEVVTAERRRVTALTQLALGQQPRASPSGIGERERRGEQRDASALGGSSQASASAVNTSCIDVAHEARAELGQTAQRVEAVRAMRHVGDEPAVEIAVAQPRQLVEQRGAQPRLEAAPDAQDAAPRWRHRAGAARR